MRSFFLAPESPRLLAVVRILTGFAVFIDAVKHWRFAVELYSTSGAPMPLFEGMGMVPPAISATTAILFSTLLVASAFCVIVGWQTRLCLLLSLVLSLWLGLLDATSTFTKYSVICVHLLLLLSFSRCGAVWSVDRRWNFESAIALSPAWPRRLLQFLLCGIYWGAAITKIRYVDFASGDLLTFALLDARWGRGWLAQWLTMHPHLVIVASIGTIFYEFIFPVLVWVSRVRPWLLAGGIVFHLTLDLFLSIGVFEITMTAMLCTFLEESDLQWIGNRLRKPGLRWGLSTPAEQDHSQWQFTRSRWFSPVAWLGVVSLLMAAGMSWQYMADWYHGYHQPPFADFVEMEMQEMQPILTEQSLSARAYFHRVEIGSRHSGSHVFGSHDEFHPGMVLYLLARLSEPHPEMRVRVIMTAPDDEGEFIHDTTIESRPSHLIIPFRMQDEFPLGEYRLELQASLMEKEDWHHIREFRFHLEH